MDSSKKRSTPEERRREGRRTDALSAGRRNRNGAPGPGAYTDTALLNQMKGEIRRLYGEKVNMVNTSYIIRPHEFKCLSRSLSKAVWGEERPLETVDDIIYAVDALCNRAESAARPGEPAETSTTLTEAGITVRLIAETLRALAGKESKAAENEKTTLTEDICALSAAKNVLCKEINAAGHATVAEVISERDRLRAVIESVTKHFSIPPGEEIVTFLRGMRVKEEKKWSNEVFLKERSAECQKRHYEQQIRQANDSIALLRAENHSLRKELAEKKLSANEAATSSATLEETVAEIKKAIEEEERAAAAERKEYAEVKKSLIEQNKRMSHLVQELILRIKKEKKEKNELIALKNSSLDAKKDILE